MSYGELIVAILMAVAIVLSLVFGILNIRQIRINQESEHKHKILSEIDEWVMDIQTAPLLEPIPFGRGEEEILRNRDVNCLIKYGKAFIKGEYIKAVSLKAFKEELYEDVIITVDNLVRSTYLKSRVLGITNIDASFGDEAVKVMEELKSKIGNDVKNITEDILSEHDRELGESTGKLLHKIGYLIGNLPHS